MKTLQERLQANLARRRAAAQGKATPAPAPKPEPAADPAPAPKPEPAAAQGATGVNPPDAADPIREPVKAAPPAAGDKKVRRPGGWRDKLAALGWTDAEQVKRWDAAKVRDYIERSVTPEIAQREAAANAPQPRRLDTFKPGDIVEHPQHGALYKVGTPIDADGKIRMTPPSGMAMVAPPDWPFLLAEDGEARYRAQQPTGVGIDPGAESRSAELPLDLAQPPADASKADAPPEETLEDVWAAEVTRSAPELDMILVGCLPEAIPAGAFVMTFDTLIEPFERAVEKDQGVAHVGLVEYGKGPATLAAVVRQYRQGVETIVEAVGPVNWPTILTVRAGHPFAAAVVPELARDARIVIRA